MHYSQLGDNMVNDFILIALITMNVWKLIFFSSFPVVVIVFMLFNSNLLLESVGLLLLFIIWKYLALLCN